MPGFNINGTGNENAVDAKNDVYRPYRWNISDIPFLSRNQRNLILDCSLPSMDFDVLTIQGQSLEYKIPQKPTFTNVDITFYDLGGLQKSFEDWMDKIWNPTNGLFNGASPTSIKRTIALDILNNSGKTARKYELYGTWPKRISHSKLSMADDNLKTLVVEFVYDYYVVTDTNIE